VKSAWGCRYYAENASDLWPTKLSRQLQAAAMCIINLWGRFWVVMPWNYPFWPGVRFIAPGTLAGNVGVLKHAFQRAAMRIER